MIITISLGDIHYHTVTNCFSPHDENFYSLTNSQIYNTVVLTIVTVLYVTSPGLNLFYNWKFVPFDPLHPFHPPSTFCLWQPPICSLYL